ncbi:aldose epimerase family protein [Flavitalea flava]
MPFSIRHSTVNDLPLVNLRDEKTGTEIALLPGYGASLHAFRVKGKDGVVLNVIDHYHDLEEMKREMGKSFKSPKLSPFPCRIADGKYQFEGKEYVFSNASGDGRGNAIHGLLYNKPFTIIEEKADDEQAALSLAYLYRQEDPAYPFVYSCQVRFVLREDNQLEAETKVTNLGKETLPIADGWHPYFQLGGRVDDWQLQFYADALVEFNDKLIPSGNLLRYNDFQKSSVIGGTFLDNCFVLKPGLQNAACELSNPGIGLSVSFFPDAAYPYLQIYTPPHRQSIAIENLSGAPDCFNNKMGLILLPEGHSQIFTVRYKVSVQ